MIIVFSLTLTNTQVVTFESSNPFSLKDIIEVKALTILELLQQIKTITPNFEPDFLSYLRTTGFKDAKTLIRNRSQFLYLAQLLGDD